MDRSGARRRGSGALRTLAGAVLVAALASPAFATSFTVTLDSSAADETEVTDPQLAEISDRFDGTTSTGPAAGEGTVFAGPSGTGALLSGEATGVSTSASSGISLFASGEMLVDDIVISRVGGSIGPEPVDVALLASFDGSVGPIGATLPGSASANALARITLTNSNLASVQDQFDPPATGAPLVYAESLQTPLLTVQTDTPIRATLFFTLGASASAEKAVGSSEDGTAHVTADFGSTLSFPKSGPVFDLPAGFTAHSASGHIVDNQVVPEPGTSLLVGVGLGTLALVRRRRLGRPGA